MGFGKNLAKGFVRSAVNQVGRDAGKVVSNQLYGDAHSVPHRSVNGSGGRREFVGENENEMRIERCEPTSTVKMCLIIFVSLLFSIIGMGILFFVGVKRWKLRNFVKGWRYYSVPHYTSDRRYRDGVRYDGDEIRREKLVLEADEWEMKQNSLVAGLYIICSVLYFVFMIIVVNAAK